MRNRLLFHFLHFVILLLLVTGAVFTYFKFGYESFSYTWKITYEFIQDKSYNFALIALGTYILTYLTGIIKFTLEERAFRTVHFLREIFKLVMILGMMSFIEFWTFYEGRIGRLIYLYLLLLYAVYYLMYLLLRSRGGPRKLLWMAQVPWENILERYLKKPENYRVIQTEEEREEAGLNVNVVYQDGHVEEADSEALIKSKLAGYQVMELAELIEKETAKIPLDYVNIHWFLEKFEVMDQNFFRINRAFDVIVSLFLLVILFPFGFLTALVHKLFSSGPVFFIQERLGLHGVPFRVIKFRTMVNDAEKHGARFSGKNDARITAIGKFMRRLRIDEIPQLFNVLRGDMSMVGPRPERGVFIDSLSKEVPYYKLRLLVPPGLTGWAQVNDAYAGNDPNEHRNKLEYDLYYIKNRSIFLDLLIMLQTVKTIILAKGE